MKKIIRSILAATTIGAAGLTGVAVAEEAEAATPDIQIGFFKLVVEAPDEMKAFYEQAFGMEVRYEVNLPGLREIIMGYPGSGVSVVLYHHTDGREITVGNGHGPVGLATADVDGYYARAMEAGATSVRAPFDLGTTRIAFLLDPEGHEVELINMER